MSGRAEWHFVTGEYPPEPGGVSDYTELLASQLAAAGDVVHVWCPAAGAATPFTDGVAVHRELGTLSARDFARADRLMGPGGDRRVIVQWVAQAYRRRSLNVPFCLWLWRRARRHGESIEIMVHEPFLEFRRQSARQSAAAAVHRLMTVILLRAARAVWVSIPAWESSWRPYALGRHIPFRWLPVPSNVAVDREADVAAVRARYAVTGDALLAGHFGTYGPATAASLAMLIPDVLERSRTAVFTLLGRDSAELARAVRRRHPALAARIHASGYLDRADVSRHLSACDVIVQPYEDGVSTRRTSVMAALAHGRAVVTSDGRFTEALWRETRAVALTPAGDVAAAADCVVDILASPSERTRLAAAAAALYRARFDILHTLATLRAGAPARAAERVAVEVG